MDRVHGGEAGALDGQVEPALGAPLRVRDAQEAHELREAELRRAGGRHREERRVRGVPRAPGDERWGQHATSLGQCMFY